MKLALNNIYVLLVIASLLIACSNERSFTWSEEIKQLTGGDLKPWLQQAPFENEWDPEAGQAGNTVFTNFKQVFPFLGDFKNENNDLKDYASEDRYFYQRETVFFKDETWGESFVHAQLLYEPEELFLKNFYSTRGDVTFSGMNAMNETYRASLYETQIYAKTADYKTGIYWVNNNGRNYLSGFYQEGQLVFQFGFACEQAEKVTGLGKIKAINAQLGLNVSEWGNASADSLTINDNPRGFWQNPYYPLYTNSDYFPNLQVKINNQPFKSLKGDAEREQVDYLFSYENEMGKYTLTFLLNDTAMSQQDYQNTNKALQSINVNDNQRKVFLTGSTQTGNQTLSMAETYFRDNRILKMTFSHPSNDANANKVFVDILENLRIRMY